MSLYKPQCGWLSSTLAPTLFLLKRLLSHNIVMVQLGWKIITGHMITHSLELQRIDVAIRVDAVQ